jgi:uncharacterized protein YceK
MIKKILFSMVIVLILVSCSSVTASKDTATYLESVDENGIFEYIKLVDKETGCKYLVVAYAGGGRSSVTQMLNKDGRPLCK